jgi:hypothetical protein
VLDPDGKYRQWIAIGRGSPVENEGDWQLDSAMFPPEVWLESALYVDFGFREPRHASVKRGNGALTIECMPWGIELGGGSDDPFRRVSRETDGKALGPL